MRTSFFVLLAVIGGLVVGTGEAVAEGLPQLDPSTYSPQLVWLAITFLLLYLLMARVALPRVRLVLEDRRRRIEDNLKKAESLKADAEAAAAEYQKMMTEARAGAQDVIRQTREAAIAESNARHKALGDKLEAEVTGAEARIAAAKQEAIDGIHDIAVEVAASVVGRLVGSDVDASVVAAAVDQTIKERA